MKLLKVFPLLYLISFILSVHSCNGVAGSNEVAEKKLVKIVRDDTLYTDIISENFNFEYDSNNKIKRIIVDSSIDYIYDYIWYEDSIIEFENQKINLTYVISNGKINEIREINYRGEISEIIYLYYDEFGNLNSIIYDDNTKIATFKWNNNKLINYEMRDYSFCYEYTGEEGSCSHYLFNDGLRISYLQIVHPELFGLKIDFIPKKSIYYNKKGKQSCVDLVFTKDNDGNIINYKSCKSGISFQYVWE